MALRFAPLALWNAGVRCGARGAATASRSGRAAAAGEGGSCAGPLAPPRCPPCEPAPAPACRAPPPAGPCALRRVCCPPPAGARPPCPSPAPACPLTCDHATAITASGFEAESNDPVQNRCDGIAMGETRRQCCGEQDNVAQRLTLAKRARRTDYEDEVAARAECRTRQTTPAARYRLGDERECAPATDGRQYVVPRCAGESARCGPDRAPPPPRCVRLAPDDNCRMRTAARLDPCAHRPRVMIEIDRSVPPATARASPPPPTPTPYPDPIPRPVSPPCPPKGIASRLMSGLKLSRGPKEPKTDKKPASGGSRCAGDSTWCANSPRPPTTPARCRRPSAAERLRGRPAKPGCGERGLHTSTMTRATDSDAVPHSKPVDGLVEVIRERTRFGEAGRGRVASDPSCGGAGIGSMLAAGGGLDLGVPAGVARVRVRVSLEGAACTNAPRAATSARVTCNPEVAADVSHVDRNRCLSSAAPPESDSWLSLKNIQKKLAGRRKTQESRSKESTKPSATPRPCPPPAPSCPSSPRPSVSPRPTGPPKKTIKPLCPTDKPQPKPRSPSDKPEPKPRSLSNKPQPKPQYPCPPKKSDSGSRSGAPPPPTPSPSQPVGPTPCGKDEGQKFPRGPARCSPTLGLIFNTIANI